jgi:hypothetical protein
MAQDRSTHDPRTGRKTGSVALSGKVIPFCETHGHLQSPHDDESQDQYQIAYARFREFQPETNIDLISSGILTTGNALDQRLTEMAKEFDHDKMHVENMRSEDLALKEIYAIQGFNGIPTVATSLDEFDSLPSPVIESGPFAGQKIFGEVKGGYDYEAGNSNARTPITELSRGFQSGIDEDGNILTAEDAIEAFRHGDHWAGLGEAGSGTYAGTMFPVATGYTDDGSMKHVLAFKLIPHARIGSYRDLQNQIVTDEDTGNLPKSLTNIGRYATAKGYDAYVLENLDIYGGQHEVDVVVVLNRSKVVLAPIPTEDIFSYRWDEARV